MADVSLITLLNGKRQVVKVDEVVLNGFVSNIEGGEDDTVFLPTQFVDGGDANGN